MSLDEASARVAAAKAAMDNGFSHVGPGLREGRKVEGMLMAAAGRVIRLANASVILCKNGHSSDAGPLVREMAEKASSMRRLAGLAGAGAEEAVKAELAGLDAEGEVSAGIPWAHLFPELFRPETPPERTLALAAAAMAAALEALEARWPGAFRGGDGA